MLAHLDNRSNVKIRLLSRACRRKFWQEDRLAPKCSMEGCTTAFSQVFFANVFKPDCVRRHHCRMCGRVVCGACSRNKQLLVASEGPSKSLPSAQRVCDACYAKDKPSDVFWRGHSGSQSACQGASGPRSMMTRVEPRESNSTLNESPATAVEKGECQPFLSTPSLDIKGASGQKRTDAATARKLLNSSSVSSDASLLEDSDDEDARSQQTTPSRPYHEEGGGKKKEVSELISVDDERVARLEKEISNCEFYDGMLANEPQAMKALLYMTLGLVPREQPV